MNEFFFYIEENGKIGNPQIFKKNLDSLTPGRYRGIFQRSTKRTLSQNAWLHAVLPDILEGLKYAGYNLRSVEEAKAVVKTLFFKKTITNGVEEIEVIEDTSATSKEDFIERADQIIRWAREYLNIDVAPPLKQTEFFQQ